MQHSHSLRGLAKGIVSCLLLISLASCAGKNSELLGESQVPQGMGALYWVLGSNQYPAITQEIYQFSRKRAQENLLNLEISAFPEQKGLFSHLPPAIIMDLDETVLNNALYLAYLFKTGQTAKKDTWKKYVNSASAQEVSGAVDFVNWAEEVGIKVFFVTNRTEDLREATLANLRKLGINFPRLNEQTFLNGKEGEAGHSDKYPRYRALAENYRILLIMGDNFSDFVNTEGLSVNEYKALLDQYRDYIGSLWIVLPNPLYGDWERIDGLGASLPVWENN